MRTGLGSTLLGARRLTLYLLFTVFGITAQAIGLALRLAYVRWLPRWYHARCARILGFDVVVKGQRSGRSPTLFVSNHVSYLDITILGSIIDGSFIAKAEVAAWPFFGILARLQRSVFIERRPTQARAHATEIQRRLAAGENLILFPEGTSGDGAHVLPFKSALFSVAQMAEDDGTDLAVQPVSVAYTRLDGIPLGGALRPAFAWYGDMALGPHLIGMCGLGRLTVEVTFHPVVTLADAGGRKALADLCWARVASGVATSNAGRPQIWEAPERRRAA